MSIQLYRLVRISHLNMTYRRMVCSLFCLHILIAYLTILSLTPQWVKWFAQIHVHIDIRDKLCSLCSQRNDLIIAVVQIFHNLGYYSLLPSILHE